MADLLKTMNVMEAIHTNSISGQTVFQSWLQFSELTNRIFPIFSQKNMV